MSDPFTAWKLVQDQMLAAQKAQVEAASRLMGMTENFDNALEAAKKVADANVHAWQTWMSMWGHKK